MRWLPNTKLGELDLKCLNCLRYFRSAYDNLESFSKANNVPDIFVGEWISVKDRMPDLTPGHPDYQGYLVYADGHVHVADYMTGRLYEARPWFYIDGEYAPSVTHWMPGPKPPKGE